jgi:hypothetical protein
VHQTLVAKTDRIAGYTSVNDERPSIKGDPVTGTVKIKFEDDGQGHKLSYTWKDFTFERAWSRSCRICCVEAG